MEEAKEPLKGRTSNINIHMKEAVGMLDGVVVIGYGTQKRGNLTGSIASVSGKILEKVQTTSAAEAIVGKLPGVQVTAVTARRMLKSRFWCVVAVLSHRITVRLSYWTDLKWAA